MPVVVLAYAAYVIRLPYFVLGPGPARDVESLIHVQGHATYQSRGHLLMTSVSFYQPNAYEAFGAWISPSETVVPRSDILGPGQSQEQETQQALSQMDTSKIDAAVVALTRYAGYPAKHGKGVLVEAVGDQVPAAGKLFAGDLIVKMDGQAVTSVDQVSAAIRAAGFGHQITFTVEAGGKTRQVSVAPGHLRQVSYPAIGVNLVANFPFAISIESDDIGGPSAGLMWTLGLVDLLTPGDLTGGRTIAGTGTIDPDGAVGPIGGIEQKVVGAERSGAKLFFAPAAEAAAARAVADGLVVVPVKSYQDAVTYLEQHP
ncbi:MAG TPA: PDZ domain-containing protein [Actinomycetota bacterium]|nr:PDZ domain-containing protein [Actinomycetota bacterium]